MDPKSGRRADRTDYVFVAPNPGRFLVRVVWFLSLVGVCVGLTLAVADREVWAMVLAGSAAVTFVASWAILQASVPQRVTVSGSVISIRRHGEEALFDLTDPGVDIRVKDGEIAFANYMDRWVVVRSKDVDWKVFTDVVMYYQSKADRNAEERNRRFSR